MILDKVWKLTNTVRVGLDARSSHTQRQSTFPDHVCSYCPPCHVVSHYENLTTFLIFWKFFSIPISDDVGGKSLSETYKSVWTICGWEIHRFEINCDTHQCEHIWGVQERQVVILRWCSDYLLSHWRTHTHTLSFVSTHTNTSEVLFNLQHHIPVPSLPTIKPCW